jgi:hypothetical protein
MPTGPKGSALHSSIFIRRFNKTIRKTGLGCRPYLLLQLIRHRILRHRRFAMASFRAISAISQWTPATASTVAAVLWAGEAFASQGPGGGTGTASNFTQLAMAIIVYGTSALVVGGGLIGAARKH